MIRKILYTSALVTLIVAETIAQNIKIAVLTDFRGDVVLKSPDGSYTKAEPEMIIPAGMSLITGEDGMAEVMFLDDSSQMIVHINSEVIFEGEKIKQGTLPEEMIKGEGIETIVQLEYGDVYFNIAEDRFVPFDVTTPNSIIAVKGIPSQTEFRVLFPKDIYVDDQNSDFMGAAINRLLAMNENITISFAEPEDLEIMGNTEDYDPRITVVLTLSDALLEILNHNSNEWKIIKAYQKVFIKNKITIEQSSQFEEDEMDRFFDEFNNEFEF